MHLRTRQRSLAAVVSIICITGCSNDKRSTGLPPVVSPGDTLALTSSDRLVSFNRDTPSIRTAVNITGLQGGESLLGIDVRPAGTPAGELYALSSAGRLYTVGASGVATLKSTLTADPTDTSTPFTGLAGTAFGLDFNPVVDRLRVVSNTGQNLRINVDTGATITDGDLNVAGAARSGVTAAAYTNSFSAACRTALYYVDSTNGRLLTTSDPNNGVMTEIGATPLSVGNGFEIVTGADGANAALAVATSSAGAVNLISINLATGVSTTGAAITGLNSNETLRGLSVAPPGTPPAQAVGELVALTDSNKLVSFVNGSPQKLCTTATASGLQTSENALGIDVRPADGAVYALGSSGRIYTVNATTGVATLKSMLASDPTDVTNPFAALAGTEFGVDFNPVADRLRVVSNTGQNLRINVDSGATTTDAEINPAGSAVTGAAYTNSVAGAGSTSLYVLDVTGDRLLLQGVPSGNPNNGDLQAVGPFGMTGDVQSLGGFDINGRTNAAFAALTVAGATASELHSINLVTGASTRVNVIGGGEKIRGLAYAAAIQVTAFGITADNRLVSFKIATPGTLDTNAVIGGLQGGENIVGADFRVANGRLYALSDAGRIYAIDPATNAGIVTASMVADAADSTAPFSALTGTAFGVDFNPVVDRLRTVSDTGQNLRSNVDTGVTTTDTALRREAFAVSSAAYANSFPGTTATMLYVIDTQSDRVLLQNPPNEGRLNDVGALGVDVTSVNGFEIVGPDAAFAVMTSTAAGTALYSINLTTGAATVVGAVALTQTTDVLSGLSLLPSTLPPAGGATVRSIVNGTALISFGLNAPGSPGAPVAITGLQVGETLLGFDYRPANLGLYAVGSTGRIYTLDPATGAATVVALLAADPTDVTASFTALAGTSFGINFNPVADRLRVVSNTGQNLRINVGTGLTTTDGDLAFPGPGVIAAAYTRNLAGTMTTALLAVDIASNTLQLQNPPNDGTLVTIGRLDPVLTFTSTGGFDIAGGDDGLALALLQPTAAAQSSLYRINTRTGAATLIGAAGPSGTPLLRGLSLRLQ